MQHDVFDIDKQTRCPECGSDQLIGDYERAEVVCANCGLVIDETLLIWDQNGEHLTTSKEIKGLV